MAAMNEQAIKAILEKFRNGTASEEELAFLETWYLEYAETGSIDMPLTERIAATDFVWTKLEQQTAPKVKPVFTWQRIAAAVLVLIVGAAVYLFLNRNNDKPLTVAELADTKYDIAPGYNRAIITDASGKTVELDSARRGITVGDNNVSYDNGASIDALKGGQSVKMMTLQTPKGGTYQITLPDGTRVWLNAATTLQFPSSFAGAERKVELSGEAYFEVAANSKLPFRVLSKGQTVEVLGTSFNLNCYPDENATYTTLIDGKVRVANATLLPGQQAINNESGIRTLEVNTDAVLGWKNNYFVFQGEKIDAIMRKISRWYDMEIVYEGSVTADDFGGRVNRYVNVSQVLKKLELTNKVHFKISGKKIIVTQ